MGTIVHPRAWLERHQARARADQWIERGFESRYPWRVAELTRRRARKRRARSLHDVIGEVNGSMVPGPVPMRIAALRPHLALLEAIEARLLDDQPISGLGMLSVDALLTSPGSCFYLEVDDVASSLTNVLKKLEMQ